MSGSSPNNINAHGPFEFEVGSQLPANHNSEDESLFRGKASNRPTFPRAPDTTSHAPKLPIRASLLVDHEIVDHGAITQLAPPITSASNPVTEPGTIFAIGDGTLLAGETTTLNQLAGQQPIEISDDAIHGASTSSHSGPGHLPRTPLFPGAYPDTESPLHYPQISSVPGIAMNTIQSMNNSIHVMGEKVGEYVPESVASYFPHTRNSSSTSYDPLQPPTNEDSASSPLPTLIPDWPRDAAKLDQAPSLPNLANLHPSAKAALDDAEYVQDKALADAYNEHMETLLSSGNGNTEKESDNSYAGLVANAAYLKDKTMDAVRAFEGTLGSAGSAAKNTLPSGVAGYLPNTSTHRDVDEQPQQGEIRTTTYNPSTTRGTPAYLSSTLIGAPSSQLNAQPLLKTSTTSTTTEAESYSNYASTDASTRTLNGSVKSPAYNSNPTSNHDGLGGLAFNHEGPHPAPTPAKLPSFLAGQRLDSNVDLGAALFDGRSLEEARSEDESTRQKREENHDDKPLAGAFDRDDPAPTKTADPKWEQTAVFPTHTNVNSGKRATSPRSHASGHGGISSTTATPGHEVPMPNVSRIQTIPAGGLSTNKTADVAASSNLEPLGKEDTQGWDENRGRRDTITEAASKPLPSSPPTTEKRNGMMSGIHMSGGNTSQPAGVLNGGGPDARSKVTMEGAHMVPVVHGTHGHVGHAKEVKSGAFDPMITISDVKGLRDIEEKEEEEKGGSSAAGDTVGSNKLTKSKEKSGHGLTTTKGDHAHPSTTTNAPSHNVLANTAGSTHPQTTPSKLTKTVKAERGTDMHPDLPHEAGDRHLDPNSHVNAPGPKKPGFMDKLKGEMKIMSGKLGGNEEKVEEGRKMMGKTQN